MTALGAKGLHQLGRAVQGSQRKREMWTVSGTIGLTGVFVSSRAVEDNRLGRERSRSWRREMVLLATTMTRKHVCATRTRVHLTVFGMSGRPGVLAP